MAGFGKHEFHQTCKDHGAIMEGKKLLTQYLFPKRSKQQGVSHVHDEVRALNHDTYGKAKVPKRASQGMRQGHRGTENYF
jgi:hypothetical protein